MSQKSIMGLISVIPAGSVLQKASLGLAASTGLIAIYLLGWLLQVYFRIGYYAYLRKIVSNGYIFQSDCDH